MSPQGIQTATSGGVWRGCPYPIREGLPGLVRKGCATHPMIPEKNSILHVG